MNTTLSLIAGRASQHQLANLPAGRQRCERRLKKNFFRHLFTCYQNNEHAQSLESNKNTDCTLNLLFLRNTYI